jgi:putative hydrolase of the HAD superfamily
MGMVKAILCDLYGTLVPQFSRSGHQDVLREVAEVLRVPGQRFATSWMQLYEQRASGVWQTLDETIEHVCALLGSHPSGDDISRARMPLETFTASTLDATDETLQCLDTFRDSELRLGLVTNCAPPLPAIWSLSDLRHRFDAVAFSCTVRHLKPSPQIYLKVCEDLGVAANECLYVGDGSSEELTGASRLGMYAVLLSRDFSDTYDNHRPEVTRWAGRSIERLSDLHSRFKPFSLPTLNAG